MDKEVQEEMDELLDHYSDKSRIAYAILKLNKTLNAALLGTNQTLGLAREISFQLEVLTSEIRQG